MLSTPAHLLPAHCHYCRALNLTTPPLPALPLHSCLQAERLEQKAEKAEEEAQRALEKKALMEKEAQTLAGEQGFLAFFLSAVVWRNLCCTCTTSLHCVASCQITPTPLPLPAPPFQPLLSA